MTETELAEFEDGAHEHALRCIIQDNLERFGEERLKHVLTVELRYLGIEVNTNYASD